MAPKIEMVSECIPVESGKIVKYLMLNGYCLGRLGGVRPEEAVIDVSMITWSGLGGCKYGELGIRYMQRTGSRRKAAKDCYPQHRCAVS